MKSIDLRQALGGAVLIGATLLATNAAAAPFPADDCPGYGMGGMMGNGPGDAMGPRMMGGQGMGPGMMGGPGYGMGPGMMSRHGPASDLNLDAEQRRKIAEIHDDLRHKHWELMGKMQDEQSRMNEMLQSDQRDDAALGKSYRTVSELRQQMYEQSVAAQKQIDAVLSREQREKMHRAW